MNVAADLIIYYRPAREGKPDSSHRGGIRAALTDFGHVFIEVVDRATGVRTYLDYWTEKNNEGVYNRNLTQERRGEHHAVTIPITSEQEAKLLSAIQQRILGSDQYQVTGNPRTCVSSVEAVLHAAGFNVGDPTDWMTDLPSTFWQKLRDFARNHPEMFEGASQRGPASLPEDNDNFTDQDTTLPSNVRASLWLENNTGSQSAFSFTDAGSHPSFDDAIPASHGSGDFDPLGALFASVESMGIDGLTPLDAGQDFVASAADGSSIDPGTDVNGGAESWDSAVVAVNDHGSVDVHHTDSFVSADAIDFGTIADHVTFDGDLGLTHVDPGLDNGIVDIVDPGGSSGDFVAFDDGGMGPGGGYDGPDGSV